MKIEVSAKTIEKAIEDGLKQLNTTIENVDVKVISEGGMFKKAKIEMELNTFDKNKVETVEEQVNEEDVNEEQNNDVEVVIEKQVETEAKDVNVVLENAVKVSEFKDELTEEEKQQRKLEMLNKTMEVATEWLNGLIYVYNINAEVKCEIRENDIYANIIGENLGVLIGYHGEAMDSIQYVLNTYLYNKLKGAKRVFIDVSGYRAKRSDDLKSLARKIADKVILNKRSYKLDPMNSFERRIIHEELSKTKNILTHSEGTEPNRYLVIEYTE